MAVITTDDYILLFENNVIKIVAVDDETGLSVKPSGEKQDVTVEDKIRKEEIPIEKQDEPDQEMPGKNLFEPFPLYAASTGG